MATSTVVLWFHAQNGPHAMGITAKVQKHGCLFDVKINANQAFMVCLEHVDERRQQQEEQQEKHEKEKQAEKEEHE